MKNEQEFILQVEEAQEEQKKQKMGLKKAALVFLSSITIGTLAFFSGSSNTQSGDNLTRKETDQGFASNREDAKKELMSRGLSLEEAEKILDETDQSVILANKEAREKAESEAAKLQQQYQSTYEEAYQSAFNYYKKHGSEASAPAEEEHYMNYNANGAKADILNKTSELGYTDGKNHGIAEYKTNLTKVQNLVEQMANVVDNSFDLSNQNTNENYTGRNK